MNTFLFKDEKRSTEDEVYGPSIPVDLCNIPSTSRQQHIDVEVPVDDNAVREVEESCGDSDIFGMYQIKQWLLICFFWYLSFSQMGCLYKI